MKIHPWLRTLKYLIIAHERIINSLIIQGEGEEGEISFLSIARDLEALEPIKNQ